MIHSTWSRFPVSVIEEKSLLPAPRHETLDPLPSTKRQTPKNYLFVYFYFTRQILPCEFSRVELQILWQFSQVKWNGCFFWRNRRMRHIFSTIGKVFVTLPKILGRLGWSAKAETVFASVYLSLLFPYPLLFCLWVIYLTITDFDTSMARDETLSKASTMDWIF